MTPSDIAIKARAEARLSVLRCERNVAKCLADEGGDLQSLHRIDVDYWQTKLDDATRDLYGARRATRDQSPNHTIGTLTKAVCGASHI